VSKMEWGHGHDGKKAHLFGEIEDTGVFKSACEKSVSMTVRPVEETPDDDIHICFTCLLLFIKHVGVNP